MKWGTKKSWLWRTEKLLMKIGKDCEDYENYFTSFQ